jgi:hypothetical protein
MFKRLINWIRNWFFGTDRSDEELIAAINYSVAKANGIGWCESCMERPAEYGDFFCSYCNSKMAFQYQDGRDCASEED